ncbi:hypothetical protein Fmac_021104 [Flemingia macrophylla]|uniref:Disease resistance protein At4g27190-like leucine-rich repeats domain-containing protein n=1 Tax=Flemingia macrophylla TaxID=520843 RepID=A0ABD1LW54_9FABA
MDSISSRQQMLKFIRGYSRNLHRTKFIPHFPSYKLMRQHENVVKQMRMLEEEKIGIDDEHADKILDDKLSMIIEYEINDDNKELDKAIHNIRPSHFANIVLFRAKNCGEKLYEFMPILVKRSSKLEAIKIENCNDDYLFNIVDFKSNEDGNARYLTLMKELELIGLEYLHKIWDANPYEILELRNRQKIHIKSCPRLEFILYSRGADRLYQLMELRL